MEEEAHDVKTISEEINKRNNELLKKIQVKQRVFDNVEDEQDENDLDSENDQWLEYKNISYVVNACIIIIT